VPESRRYKSYEVPGAGLSTFVLFEPATSGYRIFAWDYEFRPFMDVPGAISQAMLPRRPFGRPHVVF